MPRALVTGGDGVTLACALGRDGTEIVLHQARTVASVPQQAQFTRTLGGRA